MLDRLGLNEREVPVTEPHPDRSRKGLYRVSDPFVATWFALVHPFRDLLETGQLDAAWPMVKDELERRMPLAVEPVVRDLFQHACADRIPFPVTHAGRHWSPTGEFGAVYLDAGRHRAFVLELKWTHEPVGVETLAHLRARVGRDPVLGPICVGCAVVSRAGFKGRVGKGDEGCLVEVAELFGGMG